MNIQHPPLGNDLADKTVAFPQGLGDLVQGPDQNIQQKWSQISQPRGGHAAVCGTAIRFYSHQQVYIAITGRCAIDMRPERDEFDAGSSHVLDGLLGVVFVSLPLVIARVQCGQDRWGSRRRFMLSAWRGKALRHRPSMVARSNVSLSNRRYSWVRPLTWRSRGSRRHSVGYHSAYLLPCTTRLIGRSGWAFWPR